MSDELVLDVAVDRANHKPIVFRFADSEHRYTFTPSDNTHVTLATVRMLNKTADGTWAKHFGAIIEWITRGLSEEDTEHLMGRLEDPDDALVTANIQDMYYKLIDAVAGHPTTPSSD